MLSTIQKLLDSDIQTDRDQSTANSPIVKSSRYSQMVNVCVCVCQLPLVCSPQPGGGGGEIGAGGGAAGPSNTFDQPTGLEVCCFSPAANYLECAEGQQRCRLQRLLIAGCRPTALHCEVTGAAGTALHHVVTFTLTAMIWFLLFIPAEHRAHFWKSWWKKKEKPSTWFRIQTSRQLHSTKKIAVQENIRHQWNYFY